MGLQMHSEGQDEGQPEARGAHNCPMPPYYSKEDSETHYRGVEPDFVCSVTVPVSSPFWLLLAVSISLLSVSLLSS